MASSSKSCRTQFEHEDSRRSAHNQPVLLPTNGNLSAPRTVGEEIQQLVPVELLSHHGYGRSLARFAAGLGPIARKIASKKIRSILSPGVEFGPGWVGGRVDSSAHQSIPSEPTSSNTNYTYDTSRLHRPSTSDLYNAFLLNKPSMPGRSGASDRLGLDSQVVARPGPSHVNSSVSQCSLASQMPAVVPETLQELTHWKAPQR